jgi:hypothetical protein
MHTKNSDNIKWKTNILFVIGDYVVISNIQIYKVVCGKLDYQSKNSSGYYNTHPISNRDNPERIISTNGLRIFVNK